MNKDSNDNTLFITERCNNRCMMCCQPPRKADDTEFRFQENLRLIAEAPKGLTEIGITGGEPLLAGQRLFDLIDAVREKWPTATLHILTNGRALADEEKLDELLAHTGERVVMGIPLHSDYEADHDRIAGAKGAYVETMKGLYNLAARGVEIELRIILNRWNVQRLPQIADFIFKNLTFVAWVAFTGMERCGLAERNADRIWIEPRDYMKYLEPAVRSLSQRGIDTAIYNLPLCLLPSTLHPYAARSISDWKVQYLPQCAACAVRSRCCGTFATSSQPYQGIAPIARVLGNEPDRQTPPTAE